MKFMSFHATCNSTASAMKMETNKAALDFIFGTEQAYCRKMVAGLISSGY